MNEILKEILNLDGFDRNLYIADLKKVYPEFAEILESLQNMDEFEQDHYIYNLTKENSNE